MVQQKQTKKTVKVEKPKETKAELFLRLGTLRVRNVVKSLRILGNCSSNSYEYTPEQVEALITTIRTSLEQLESKFNKTKSVEKDFTF